MEKKPSNCHIKLVQAKALNIEKLRAFVLPIEQDRSRGDSVKTEYDQDQGFALVESDEEAVGLCSTALLRMAAKHSAAAPDTADPQRDGPIRLENTSFIVRMNRKTGGASAGTGKPVELELINNGIVRSLRKLIVISDRYEYHGLVRHSPSKGCDWCRDSRQTFPG